MNFTDTPFCAKREHCVICRDKIGGAEWRKAMSKSFEVDGGADFPCPFGVPWGYDGSVLYGEVVAKIAQPIAKAIDRVAGTNLQDCKACKKRRKKLNEVSVDTPASP